MGNALSSQCCAEGQASKPLGLPARLKTQRSWLSIPRLKDVDQAWEPDKAAATSEKRRLKHVSNPISLGGAQTDDRSSDFSKAYSDFMAAHPEYEDSRAIDLLRASEFSRLTRSKETYVDYMGGSLYPECLVRAHYDLLVRNVMGNTHSVSNSSALSSHYAAEARTAVLRFFNAPSGYTVIFTANATAALKLVGESYPFGPGGAYVLPADCHNSINGIRRFATQAGAKVVYIPAGVRGGCEVSEAIDVLQNNRPPTPGETPCLFAITGLSNISNSKTPLAFAGYATSLGYHTLLDAAALAPSSRISLQDTPVDAMAVSFYKMFGFPTGVGALVVRESFLKELRRPWFAGGTVDIVQVPGSLVTMASHPHEQFEDGTINYLSLPAITEGLALLHRYLPFLPVRHSVLLHYLILELSRLRHPGTDVPVVKILSSVRRRRIKLPEEQSDTGSTVSLIFLDSHSRMIPNSFIEFAAARQRISLRTGCLCNPGGAAALLGLEDEMSTLEPGMRLKDFERAVGEEPGVVRISLGLVSSFEDVWRCVQFAGGFTNETQRQTLFNEWEESRRIVT